MLKKLLIGLAILAGLSGPVHGAGTIPGFSLAQQIGSNGVPLVGCKLYIIQAGTTSTPQNGYSDSGLTLPLPNPVTCDGYGRLPQIFVADGNIKVRLTTSGGLPVTTLDGILAIGASSGGGGGSPVDATTILATGDVKYSYRTGGLTGFVRANGRTIGSASSGASERANADCQALFEFLWTTDPNLTVSTGRGASANADWVANKTITLPDFRGRVLVGPDAMGNSASNRLGSGAGSFTTNRDTLGFGAGAEVVTLAASQIPSITSANTSPIALNVATTATNIIDAPNGIASTSAGLGGSNSVLVSTTATIAQRASTGSILAGNAPVTSNNTGGNPFDKMPPAILVTTYMKL